jgi:hypothetical protein
MFLAKPMKAILVLYDSNFFVNKFFKDDFLVLCFDTFEGRYVNGQ